jgi:hypothetical protein
VFLIDPTQLRCAGLASFPAPKELSGNAIAAIEDCGKGSLID